MPFDFKKEYKEFYSPSIEPSIVTLPRANYIAVRGKGDPNSENGEYKSSISLLYGIIFTIKMCEKNGHVIKGAFPFVVPPLEGFWWQENRQEIDYQRKEDFHFISVIRLPEFVTQEEFDWAIQEATKKKKMDFSKVEFFTYEEGQCVQCMHTGSYDEEPSTIEKMHAFIHEKGFALDMNEKRFHHEIYLSDPRRIETAKLKTVIRHPIRKVE